MLEDGVDTPANSVLGIWLLSDVSLRASLFPGGTGEFGSCFDKDFTSDPTIVFQHITPVAILSMIAWLLGL